MKKAVLALLLLTFHLGLLAQESHFGYIDYNKALKSLPEYEQAQKSLDELKSTYDKEMERSEQELNKQFKEFIDGQKTFPENILLKRQKELQQLMEQSLKFKDEAENLLTNAESELMEPVHKKLKDTIAKVAVEKGLDFVANSDNNAYPYFNTEKGIDITELVISEAK